jgi:hypothetical protein
MKKAISVLMTAALIIFSLALSSKKMMSTNPNPQTYVLVHGAWQAPYV